MQPAASIVQVGWVNDLYDGKKADGLENGADKYRKYDYADYSPDHYDSVKSKKAPAAKKVKKAKKDKSAKKDAKKGGIPPELQGTKAAMVQSKSDKRPEEEL
jgi:hypothetical protein